MPFKFSSGPCAPEYPAVSICTEPILNSLVKGACLTGDVGYGSEGYVAAGYGEDASFGVDFGHGVAGFSFDGVFDASVVNGCQNKGWDEPCYVSY